MSLDPSKLALVKGRDFIPVQNFSGLLPYFRVQSAGSIGTNMEIGLSANSNAATLEGGTAITAERILTTNPPVVIRGPLATSSGGLIALTASGLVGYEFGGTPDEIRHIMVFPPYWSREHKVYARVLWTTDANAVGNRTVEWRVESRGLTPGSDFLDFGTVGDLDSLIPSQAPSGTAFTVERTERGYMTKAKQGWTDSDVYLQIGVVLKSFDPSFTEKKILLGVEFEYTPKLGAGNPRIEARDWSP